ncbi:hypothetical protein QCA50_000653 [Cerrena zonata]|uniref:Uncharacterized protein n=1 Tax=Cerrena zonata TaxID=2478898 RepID=A0AAW0GQY3_9APHY
MDRESADILGGRLNIAQQDSGSSLWSTVQLFLLLAVSLASLFAWIRLQPAWAKYQDRRYRKQKRRKYGIPDDDNRPFEVAHAAAVARRKPIRLERVQHDADAQRIGGDRHAGLQPFIQEQGQSLGNGYAQPTETQSTRRLVKRGNSGHVYATSPTQASYNTPIYTSPQDPQDSHRQARTGILINPPTPPVTHMAIGAQMSMMYMTTINNSIRTKSSITGGMMLLKNTMIPRWSLMILQM